MKNTKKIRRKKKFGEIDWHKVIVLSTAGDYIAKQLHDELTLLTPKKKKK